MKINGIEVKTNGYFAYDGCHKIYVVEDEEDMQKIMQTNYKIVNIRKLEETYKKSCSLKFIHNWKLDKTYVGQYEKAVFE